jgi:hypothetical protein
VGKAEVRIADINNFLNCVCHGVPESIALDDRPALVLREMTQLN